MEEERKILHDLVKQEATKLRMFAELSELNNLNIDSLDSDDVSRCIYGQMTGCCFSDRANDLIMTCCDKIYDTIKPYNASRLAANLNCNILADSEIGEKPYDISNQLKNRLFFYVSPIEKFIDIESPYNIELLVKYLKGEIEELNFV